MQIKTFKKKLIELNDEKETYLQKIYDINSKIKELNLEFNSSTMSLEDIARDFLSNRKITLDIDTTNINCYTLTVLSDNCCKNDPPYVRKEIITNDGSLILTVDNDEKWITTSSLKIIEKLVQYNLHSQLIKNEALSEICDSPLLRN